MPHPSAGIEKFKAVQLVIFDWSGVISDDRKPVYEANCEVMRSYGHEPEDFANWLLHTNASAPLYFASRGLTAPHDELLEKYRTALHRARHNGTHPVLYDDVKTTLAGLAGKQKFVVSMHPTNHLVQEAMDYGIAKYFAGVMGEVKDKSVAIGDITHGEQTAIYIGDTIFDIQAARKAGVFAAAVPTGYQTKAILADAHPDVMLDKLSDLLHYL